MAADYESSPANKQVVDEEGEVDTKLKLRIINARERVDEREDLLFVQPTVDPNNQFNRQQAALAWGGTVRQYLRTIEPLLRSEEVALSEKYYTDVGLGEVTLTPPDKHDIPFSKFSDPSVDETGLFWEYGIPPSADIPKPVTVQFGGLQSVLRREFVEHSWSVEMEGGTDGPMNTQLQLHTSQPVPRHVLENAIREADYFLQQTGVGLDIGHQEKDEPEQEAF